MNPHLRSALKCIADGIRARTLDERWNAEMVLGIKDSVAKAVYEFGKNEDDKSDEDDGETGHEPNQEE